MGWVNDLNNTENTIAGTNVVQAENMVDHANIAFDLSSIDYNAEGWAGWNNRLMGLTGLINPITWAGTLMGVTKNIETRNPNLNGFDKFNQIALGTTGGMLGGLFAGGQMLNRAVVATALSGGQFARGLSDSVYNSDSFDEQDWNRLGEAWDLNKIKDVGWGDAVQYASTAGTNFVAGNALTKEYDNMYNQYINMGLTHDEAIAQMGTGTLGALTQFDIYNKNNSDNFEKDAFVQFTNLSGEMTFDLLNFAGGAGAIARTATNGVKFGAKAIGRELEKNIVKEIAGEQTGIRKTLDSFAKNDASYAFQVLKAKGYSGRNARFMSELLGQVDNSADAARVFKAFDGSDLKPLLELIAQKKYGGKFELTLDGAFNGPDARKMDALANNKLSGSFIDMPQEYQTAVNELVDEATNSSAFRNALTQINFVNEEASKIGKETIKFGRSETLESSALSRSAAKWKANIIEKTNDYAVIELKSDNPFLPVINKVVRGAGKVTRFAFGASPRGVLSLANEIDNSTTEKIVGLINEIDAVTASRKDNLGGYLTSTIGESGKSLREELLSEMYAAVNKTDLLNIVKKIEDHGLTGFGLKFDRSSENINQFLKDFGERYRAQNASLIDSLNKTDKTLGDVVHVDTKAGEQIRSVAQDVDYYQPMDFALLNKAFNADKNGLKTAFFDGKNSLESATRYFTRLWQFGILTRPARVPRDILANSLTLLLSGMAPEVWLSRDGRMAILNSAKNIKTGATRLIDNNKMYRENGVFTQGGLRRLMNDTRGAYQKVTKDIEAVAKQREEIQQIAVKNLSRKELDKDVIAQNQDLKVAATKTETFHGATVMPISKANDNEFIATSDNIDKAREYSDNAGTRIELEPVTDITTVNAELKPFRNELAIARRELATLERRAAKSNNVHDIIIKKNDEIAILENNIRDYEADLKDTYRLAEIDAAETDAANKINQEVQSGIQSAANIETPPLSEQELADWNNRLANATDQELFVISEDSNTPAEVYDTIIKYLPNVDSPDLIIQIAGSSKTSNEILENIINSYKNSDDFYGAIGEAISNPNISPETLAKLAEDSNEDVVMYVAQNPNTPPETLAKLAENPDSNIRLDVVANPNTPPETLAKLAKDEDKDISIWAQTNPNFSLPEGYDKETFDAFLSLDDSAKEYIKNAKEYYQGEEWANAVAAKQAKETTTQQPIPETATVIPVPETTVTTQINETLIAMKEQLKTLNRERKVLLKKARFTEADNAINEALQSNITKLQKDIADRTPGKGNQQKIVDAAGETGIIQYRVKGSQQWKTTTKEDLMSKTPQFAAQREYRILPENSYPKPRKMVSYGETLDVTDIANLSDDALKASGYASREELQAAINDGSWRANQANLVKWAEDNNYGRIIVKENGEKTILLSPKFTETKANPNPARKLRKQLIAKKLEEAKAEADNISAKLAENPDAEVYPNRLNMPEVSNKEKLNAKDRENEQKIIEIFKIDPNAGESFDATIAKVKELRNMENQLKAQQASLFEQNYKITRSIETARKSGMTSVFDKAWSYRGYDIEGFSENPIKKAEASSQDTQSALYNSGIGISAPGVKAKGGSYVADLEPSNPRYFEGWAAYINYFGKNDEVTKMLAAGKTPTEIKAWLKTGEGKKYSDRIQVGEAYNKASFRSDKDGYRIDVDTYVNMKVDEVNDLFPVPELRERFLAGEDITESEIMDLMRGKTLKTISGRLVDNTEYFGGIKQMEQLMDTATHLLATLPQDTLFNIPLASAYFKKEMKALVDINEAKFGETLTVKQLSDLQDTARINAIKEMRKWIYNVQTRSKLTEALSLFMPFLTAYTFTLRSLKTAAVERPEMVLWTAAMINKGLGQMNWIDKDGNPTNMMNSSSLVIPLSKEIRDVVKNGPFGAILGDSEQIRISTKSLNVWFGGEAVPGVGPLVSIPTNAAVSSNPVFAREINEATKWAMAGTGGGLVEYVLPFGPSNEPIFDQLAPQWIKNVMNLNEQSQAYINTYGQVLAYETGRSRTEEGYVPLTAEQIHERVSAIYGLKLFTTLFAPAATNPVTEIELAREKYRIYRQQFGDGADQKFMTDYPELIGATISSKKNTYGVGTDIKTVENIQKYKGINNILSMSGDGGKDLGGWAFNPSGQSEFDDYAWSWLQDNPAAVGGENFFTTMTPQEMANKAVAKAGWADFNKYMGLLDAEALDRGTTVDTDKELTAYRKTIVNSLKQKYPEWEADYLNTDSLRYENRVQTLEAIMSDPQWIKDNADRADVQSISLFLKQREEVKQELNYRASIGKPGSLASNRDLNIAYSQFIMKLKRDSVDFSDFYNRYFGNDQLR